jgi:TrkA domain protein
VNRSIGELDIRQSYGVTIIAIIKKNHQKLLNPGPETLIEEGDTLVVSGERETLKKLIADLLEKGDSR